MSHILDALQKLQEEKTAQLKQSAITAGILLDAGTPRPPKAKRYLMASLAAMALVIGVVAFWLIQRPNPQARPKQPLTEQQQLALQPPAVVPPPLQTAPAAVPVALPAVKPAVPAIPAQLSPDEDEEDRASRQTKRANAATTVAPVPSAPDAPVTVGAPEGVKLSGIAWHDSRKLRRAVINDLLVAEGAEVAGARIVEIRTNLVRLEKNGTRFEVVLPH